MMMLSDVDPYVNCRLFTGEVSVSCATALPDSGELGIWNAFAPSS